MSEEIVAADRRGSDSIKWGLYAEDVLPLWVADMDFRSPAMVIEALRNRVEEGVFGYPKTPHELPELVAARLMERYAWKINPQDILILPGVVPGFNLVCQALVNPGQSLVVQPPVYPPILQAAANAGVQGIFSPLVQHQDGSYGIDFDCFERDLRPETRCLLLCNPHNPVGRVFSRSELEQLARICLRHKMVICSDEIHSDLTFSGNHHIPIASLSEEIANSTVSLIAPSKTFNIAGLECAVLICTNPQLMKQIISARKGLLGEVNLMGLTAAVAAYRSGDAWLGSVLKLLQSNRDYLKEYLEINLPQIRMCLPEATCLAWLDCRDLDLPEGASRFFLKQAKVALNRGEEFGEGGKGFARLNFGCSRAILTEALERMEAAIEKQNRLPSTGSR